MIATERTVFCDLCGEWKRYLCRTKKSARKLAKKDGWLYSKGQDICPNCQNDPVV